MHVGYLCFCMGKNLNALVRLGGKICAALLCPHVYVWTYVWLIFGTHPEVNIYVYFRCQTGSDSFIDKFVFSAVGTF